MVNYGKFPVFTVCGPTGSGLPGGETTEFSTISDFSALSPWDWIGVSAALVVLVH